PRDLALDVVAGLTECFQSQRAVVEQVQPGDDAIQLVPDREALRLRHSRQTLVPENAALDIVHDVERRADDRVVLAERMRPRHRKAGAMQCRDHAVLAVHGVRRWQQFARRLAAQYEPSTVHRGEKVRRIRLSALELLEARKAQAEVFFERAGIDAMPLLDRLRADELLEHGAGSLP